MFDYSQVIGASSQCFGNSHSCVQIKSSGYCNDASAKLKYLNSYDYISNLVDFIKSLESFEFGSTECILVSHQHSQTSKKIGLGISLFINSSVLYWHIVKQSFIFIAASIFNLQFFVWVFFKTLMMNCVVFLMELWHNMSR